jgi:hypothetical protein
MKASTLFVSTLIASIVIGGFIYLGIQQLKPQAVANHPVLSDTTKLKAELTYRELKTFVYDVRLLINRVSKTSDTALQRRSIDTLEKFTLPVLLNNVFDSTRNPILFQK